MCHTDVSQGLMKLRSDVLGVVRLMNQCLTPASRMALKQGFPHAGAAVANSEKLWVKERCKCNNGPSFNSQIRHHVSMSSGFKGPDLAAMTASACLLCLSL